MDRNLVWINGMPRSGTSWLSQIFESHPDVRFRLSPLFSYAFKNVLDINSSREDWLNFFKKVYDFEGDEFMTQSYRRNSKDYPTFKLRNTFPANLVIKDTRFHNLTQNMLELVPELKIIHIIRNPCAVINSWLKSTKEFPQHHSPKKYWKTGENRKIDNSEFWGFDDWVKLSKMYLKLQELYPNQILILRYEELVKETMLKSTEVFNFCNLTMNNQTSTFIKNCHNTHSESDYAVYKNKDKVLNSWKKQLDKEIINAIQNQLKDSLLEKYMCD